MLHFLKRMPIKRQLMLLAGSTGIIMVTLIVIVYLQISNVITNNNRQYTNDIFRQINSSITSRCSFMDRILSNIAFSNTIQNYLMESDPYKRFQLSKDVDNFMMNMSDLDQGILDICIINEKGETRNLHGRNDSLQQVLNRLPTDKNNYYSEVVELEYNTIIKKCFVIVTKVNSVITDKNLGAKIGNAVIVLNANTIGLETEKRVDSSNSTFFYLADRNNKLYSSNTGDIGLYESFRQYSAYASGDYSATRNGSKYFISIDKIPKYDGKIVSITPQKLLLAQVAWIRQITFVILVAAAALLSIPFLLIINNILFPLKGLLRFIYAVKNGDLKLLKKRLKLEGFEEIEIIAVEFNNMMDEIDKLTQGLIAKSTMLYEAELAKKQSELAYLKSQINPHFLYNTLEAMKGCAFDEGAERTAGMARALARVFRYSVKGEDNVSLMEEVEIVKSYVQIQQMRFDNKFDVIYGFSNEALVCRVPKMVLQPIVENAIFHGLEAKMDRGRLKLDAYVDAAQDLVIWVEDDGVGIEEDKLQEINEQLENNNKSILDNSSIGIFNVNNRLKLTYGEKYGIRVYSIVEKGTRVMLKIPTGGAAI